MISFLKGKLIKVHLFIIMASGISFSQSKGQSVEFYTELDLLLVQYDFKTDVDDLHAAAAFATLMANPAYADINYHAVAGTYGIQEGLYVPPNQLMERAFGNHWSDAHTNFGKALGEVLQLALETLDAGGNIWIADGGQSDFSAALVRAIQDKRPNIKTTEKIHIIQHSSWNEQVTMPEHLNFVKVHTDYRKIPDGNAVGNGTPGFKTHDNINLEAYLKDQHIVEVWKIAIDLANRYNGAEKRYLNTAISAGGLDFSDFSEVCYILGLTEILDANQFFKNYAK